MVYRLQAQMARSKPVFRQIGAPLRLKTGTLKNVRALAGYWLGDGSTPPLVIVVLINSVPTTIWRIWIIW